jgi:hypothetical protein
MIMTAAPHVDPLDSLGAGASHGGLRLKQGDNPCGSILLK